MKLAEALLLRGDIQKKLASLKQRVSANVLCQEGSEPLEDSNELLKEAFRVIEELKLLVAQINTTNLQNKLPDGRTLTEAIAQRDSLEQKHSLIQTAIAATHKEPDRYSVREIKWISMIEVKKYQKQSEELAKQLRELNAKIQEMNWKIEI